MEKIGEFFSEYGGLLNSIVMFILMFILQAAVLVGSIWFYLSIA